MCCECVAIVLRVCCDCYLITSRSLDGLEMTVNCILVFVLSLAASVVQVNSLGSSWREGYS